jgi:hypothetical protein
MKDVPTLHALKAREEKLVGISELMPGLLAHWVFRVPGVPNRPVCGATRQIRALFNR